METEIIIIITVVAAIVLWILSRAMVRSYVETVTIWDYQTGLHFKNGCFIESLDSGKHRLWGRGRSRRKRVPQAF